MANIHGIEVSGETYDLEDTTARSGVQTNTNNIESIDSKIPTSASSTNKLATQSDIPDISQLASDIENIQAVMPSSATAQNKLATLNDLTKAKLFIGENYKGQCKVDSNGLYLLFIDRHGSAPGIAAKLVACYSNNTIESVNIANNTQKTFTATYNSETKTISVSGATGISVNALFVGPYF